MVETQPLQLAMPVKEPLLLSLLRRLEVEAGTAIFGHVPL